jgi:hypothetical protein
MSATLGRPFHGASNSGRWVYQEQHREPPHPLDHEIEHFQRGSVGPMNVLEQRQHRLFPG